MCKMLQPRDTQTLHGAQGPPHSTCSAFRAGRAWFLWLLYSAKYKIVNWKATFELQKYFRNQQCHR